MFNGLFTYGVLGILCECICSMVYSPMVCWGYCVSVYVQWFIHLWCVEDTV